MSKHTTDKTFMKMGLLTILSIVGILFFINACLSPKSSETTVEATPQNTPEALSKAKRSIAPPLLGVNIGKEYDQKSGEHPIKEYIDNLRVFVQLEDVYDGKYPTANDPHYNPNKLDDWDYSMTGYRHRFRQMKKQGFDVRISLESIFEKDSKGKHLRHRKFPNKSFSREEWGGDEKNIKANAKKLAVAIHHMFGEFIDRLEFTNEAWGEPGFEATKWVIQSMSETFKELNSPFKLSLGAYQAYEPKNHWKCKSCMFPTGDYIGNVFEPWMTKYIDEITVHPYSFTLGTLKFQEPPLNNPKSEFQYLYDMVKWRDKNYPDLKLSITEIGWNSEEIGEARQAAYMNQVYEEATRLQLHAVYFYETVDSPHDGLYTSCGMFTTKDAAREPLQPKEFLLELKKKENK